MSLLQLLITSSPQGHRRLRFSFRFTCQRAKSHRLPRSACAIRGEQIPQLNAGAPDRDVRQRNHKSDPAASRKIQVHEATVPESIGRTPKPKPPIRARFVSSGLVGGATCRPPSVTLICQELTVWSTPLRNFFEVFRSARCGGPAPVSAIWRCGTGPSTPAR